MVIYFMIAAGSIYRSLEAISKGPQLIIKIDGSSSCSGKVF
jgi:hypothetical protein